MSTLPPYNPHEYAREGGSDFCLAKVASAGTQGDPSLSPTVTSGGTQDGVVLGTAAYMSPEQAKGPVGSNRRWDHGATVPRRAAPCVGRLRGRRHIRSALVVTRRCAAVSPRLGPLDRVPVRTGDDFVPGVATELVQIDFHDAAGSSFAVSADWRRLLVNKPVDVSYRHRTPVTLVTGWAGEVSRKLKVE